MNVDIAIIGAGTAGLSAFKEAILQTKNIVLIDCGPLGTTCARIGCMPSKVLIQTANDFYKRHTFTKRGIVGAEKLSIDLKHVMSYVRYMRDNFVKGVLNDLQDVNKYLLNSEVRFIEPYVLQVNNKKIFAKNIIIATGSHSVIPNQWQKFHESILTNENIFEQKSFPSNIGIIGLGPIGLELGQAMARLGIEINGFSKSSFIAGLSDPLVNQSAIDIISEEFPLHLSTEIKLEKTKQLHINSNNKMYTIDKALVAIGHKPNLDELNLTVFNLKRDKNGYPVVDPQTMQAPGHRLFFAGDVSQIRPLLHEASDAGRIAGFNATQDSSQCFKRRCPLAITFCEPNIAIVGESFKNLQNKDVLIGTTDFSLQGRAKILCQNQGHLQIYADKNSGLLLGAEMIAPHGEHLAHLLAWVIQQKMTVFDTLKLPFYHPTVEEGMRKALRDISKQANKINRSFDLAMCNSSAEDSLE